MCNLAAEESWLMVDPWEAFQSYQRTAIVLDHFHYEINTVLGGVQTAEGEHRDVHVMLLAGSDLISTMSEPGVWSHADVRLLTNIFIIASYTSLSPKLDHILGRYGTFIVERAGSGMDQATNNLARWRNNIYLISQLIQNDVSSTKVRSFSNNLISLIYRATQVRLFLRRGLSVRYLLPNVVVDYIEQHGLYLDEGVSQASNPSHPDKGKDKAVMPPANSTPSTVP